MNYAEFARFYDKLQEADYEAIGEYFHKHLTQNNATGGILLDLGCGTGRLSRYFAEKNYDVIGVDVSPEMLSIAAVKPRKSIQYLCQDMTRLDLYGTIDCCICVMDVLNHLPDAESLKKAFAGISLFMNKGGVLVFDVNTLHKHSEILGGQTFVYELDNLYCVWQNSPCEDGEVDMTLDVFAHQYDVWERHTEKLSETAYPLERITEMLVEAGFGDVKIFDWLSDEPANEISEKAVFSAIKM